MIEEKDSEEIWNNFTESIKSPYTCELYEHCIKKYMNFHNIENVKDLLCVGDRKTIQKQIIDFIKARKQQRIASQSIAVEIAALSHFYTYNDYTEINWKLVRSYLGERIKTVKDRAYRIEEIREMFQYASLRMKVLILILTSTGVRIGGLLGMKVGDLHPTQNLYKIYVYPRTADEYFVYCTPECRQYIDKYLQYRKDYGEKITPNSPLLREEFDRTEPASVNNPRTVGVDTLRNLMREIAIKAKVRTPPDGSTSRKNIMLFHAYRKHYYRALNRADIKPEVREFLMGHKTGNTAMGVTNLMMVYDATEDNEALFGYMKAIPSLTIFEANVLKQELDEAKVKLSLEQEQRMKMREEILAEIESRWMDAIDSKEKLFRKRHNNEDGWEQEWAKMEASKDSAD